MQTSSPQFVIVCTVNLQQISESIASQHLHVMFGQAFAMASRRGFGSGKFPRPLRHGRMTVHLPNMMTLAETAERARITERTLLSYIADGIGPTVTKFRGRTLIREDHFLSWLNSRASNPGRAA